MKIKRPKVFRLGFDTQRKKFCFYCYMEKTPKKIFEVIIYAPSKNDALELLEVKEYKVKVEQTNFFNYD